MTRIFLTTACLKKKAECARNQNYRFPVRLAATIILLSSIAIGTEGRADFATQHLVARLVPSSLSPVNRFAIHMDVDGSRVLVGAAEGGFLFTRPSTPGIPWVQDQFLRASFAHPFGAPVSLQNNFALFGADSAGPVAQQSGAAYFFQRDTSSEPYVRSQIVWPADSAMFDQFGYDVALGDGFAFVGANNDSHNGKTSTGTITLFEQVGGASAPFTETTKFAPADLTPGDDFGSRLALDATTLAVSADGQGPDVGGAIYLFDRNEGGTDNWGQVAKLTHASVKRFGTDVAVAGNTLIGSTIGSIAPGSAFIHERDADGVGQWGQVKVLVAPNSQKGDEFGFSVAIQGDFAVVGARNAFTEQSGRAYVYRRNEGGPNNWGLIAELSSPDPYAAEYFGTDVGIMGDLVLVGSLGFGSNPLGTVYVFSVPEPSPIVFILPVIIWLVARRNRPLGLSLGASVRDRAQ